MLSQVFNKDTTHRYIDKSLDDTKQVIKALIYDSNRLFDDTSTTNLLTTLMIFFRLSRGIRCHRRCENIDVTVQIDDGGLLFENFCKYDSNTQIRYPTKILMPKIKLRQRIIWDVQTKNQLGNL